MTYPAEWRPVLDQELERWSVLSATELVSQLKEEQTYQVEFRSKMYQVEVTLLENTNVYVHVGVSVDDGHGWRAMHPASSSFIVKKFAARANPDKADTPD